MTERTYLSIGDVLSLLKGEFPDITISKIRFLESQGLLDPERTPSGYRKFYEEDVDRLRWILRQQRENFLPLKVIKGRLGGNGGGSGEGTGGPSRHSESHDPESTAGGGVGVARTAMGSRAGVGGSSMGAALRSRGVGTPGAPVQGSGGHPVGARGGAPLHQGPEPGARLDPLSDPEELAPTAAGRAGPRQEGTEDERTAREPKAQTSTRTPAAPAAPASTAKSRFGGPSQPRVGRDSTTGAAPPETRATGGPADRPGESAAGRSRAPEETAEEETGGPLSIGLSGVNLTGDELAGASGLSEDEIGELVRYGLLVGRAMGDTTYYDEEALTVARLAAGFRRFGIEARHLRMYRTAADREASFFEQIVMPMLKQRNPVARRRAVDTLAELARLGQGLRGSLLRSALKDNTGG